MVGIQSFKSLVTAFTATANIVLASTGLTSKIAANKRQKIRFWLPFTVGAAGGLRLQIVVPAAVVSFSATIRLNNTVAPSSTIATQAASAAFTNAAANAGRHWLEVEVDIVNGVNAGLIDLQMAQNTSDAVAMTLLAGASMEVFKY